LTAIRAALAVSLLLALGALPVAVGAQPAERVYRVGYLASASRAASVGTLSAFVDGMRELGYREGRTLAVESRFADDKFELLPALARELIDLRPDLLVVSTTPASLAAKAATATVPLVFVSVADPVGVGLVPNVARPGGNLTGVTHMAAELTGKRLALLKEIVPGAARVGVLVNPDDPNATPQIRHAEVGARSLKIQLDVFSVRSAGDLERAFDAAVAAGDGALLRMVDPTVRSLRVRTAELAIRHRLPVMYAFREDVEAGGLVAYGANLLAQYRQAASLADKILRGATAGSLPVEQPTKFELVVNARTARMLGLTLPQPFLLRADHVVQ
jgi:putative ABC transport system substrate-binding protein